MADEAKILVRMPRDLVALIDAKAELDRRSRNAEIIILLEKALKAHGEKD